MDSYKPINPNFPPAIKNLIIINFIFWLASIILPKYANIDIVDWLGLHYWLSDKFNPAQLITYMFLHDTSSFSHIFFNMFGLWMFGKNIEMFWGTKRFLIFYFVTGIGAGIIQELTWMVDYVPIVNAINEYASSKDISQLMPYLKNIQENTIIPIDQLMDFKTQILNQPITVGASGALFGILLAFAMLFPQARMFMIFIPIPIRAPYFVAFYALAELFMGIGGNADGIAHYAHLGGMLFGLILILIWKKKGTLYQ
ncbi:MAG: Rhomboid family protein [Bacteroidetes bacterium ADurb.Bin302]|nr:MAG: Rhomboid family protein [Bacteroidetes bacterium ADurb.Bin302]HPG56032.1 rhomboid family intramembrane serine protease [Candidatus Enterocola sp.]